MGKNVQQADFFQLPLHLHFVSPQDDMASIHFLSIRHTLDQPINQVWIHFFLPPMAKRREKHLDAAGIELLRGKQAIYPLCHGLPCQSVHLNVTCSGVTCREGHAQVPVLHDLPTRIFILQGAKQAKLSAHPIRDLNP